MTPCSVQEATHVTLGGRVRRIVSKWGIDEHGHLAPPSQGGFGVVTENGQRVTMFEADSYFRE